MKNIQRVTGKGVTGYKITKRQAVDKKIVIIADVDDSGSIDDKNVMGAAQECLIVLDGVGVIEEPIRERSGSRDFGSR